MNNILKHILGALFGVFAGIFLVQWLYYAEYGGTLNITTEAKHVSRDFVILLCSMVSGVLSVQALITRNALKDRMLQVHFLEEEMTAKTRIIGFAAHALRTPASALKWAVAELLQGEYGSFSQEQRAVLEKLDFSAETLMSIIEDYLHVSELKPRSLKVSFACISLVDFEQRIQSILEGKRERATRKQVTLRYVSTLAEEPLTQSVMADLPRLMRVIESLTGNAIDYTSAGGEIRIQTSIADENFLFEIRDTGIGIAAEDKLKIFSELFRATNARQAKTSGVGISLFIARVIVDAHNGKLWFDSRENKGTTFYMRIPLCAPKPTEEFETFLKKI